MSCVKDRGGVSVDSFETSSELSSELSSDSVVGLQKKQTNKRWKRNYKSLLNVKKKMLIALFLVMHSYIFFVQFMEDHSIYIFFIMHIITDETFPN